MTDGLTSFNLTQTVVTVEQVARIVTFEVGFVTSSVERTVFVLGTINAEASERLVVGVSAGVLRTGARRLMVDDGADGVGSADGRSARIRAGFASGSDDAGQIVAAAGIVFALIGCHAARWAVSVSDSAFRTGTAEGSGCVGAGGGRVTGLSGAFVDIDASGESSGETRCAFALAVAANLCGCAIRIRTASRTTSAIDADFTGQAVVVAVTDFDATSGHATFSSGAVVVVRAGRIAAIRSADHSGGACGASGA